MRTDPGTRGFLIAAAVLLAAGPFLPKWLSYIATISLGYALVVAGVVPYVYLTLQKYEGTRRAAEYVWRGWGSGPRAALILAIYTIFFVVILILTRRVLVGWRQKKWMNRMHWFELLRAATRGQVRVNQSDLDAGFVKSLKGEVSAKEGENLVLEFSEFRQLDFAEDVWGRMPRRADLT